eukprot:150983-Alexandrium_andersonii.AAC.1
MQPAILRSSQAVVSGEGQRGQATRSSFRGQRGFMHGTCTHRHKKRVMQNQSRCAKLEVAQCHET